MTKDLKHIGPGESGDPINDVVSAIRAVAAINGHAPDDAEIRDLLEEAGVEASEETIASVREAAAKG